MEVTIKKTKLTKAIFNQIRPASYRDLRDGTILGWCIPGANQPRWIIIQFENVLAKIPMIKYIEHRSNSDNSQFIFVAFHGAFVGWTHDVSSSLELESAMNVYKAVKAIAETKGQFYL